MTNTERYLRSLLNWKSFNFILDRVTRLEDESINFRICVSLGNFKNNLLIYEYTFNKGDEWFYDEDEDDPYYNINKYIGYGLLYRIYLVDGGSFALINELTNKLSGRFEIMFKDSQNLVFEEKITDHNNE